MREESNKKIVSYYEQVQQLALPGPCGEQSSKILSAMNKGFTSEELAILQKHELPIPSNVLMETLKDGDTVRQKSDLTLVKMAPGSWRDLAKIPARIPPGSRRDFGRRDSYRDSWREAGFPAAKISAGSRRESCRDSWRETGFPAAKISAGSRRESCRDSWREAGFSAAKISAGSRRESCRDSWRETGFPAAKISAGSRRESCRDSFRVTGFPAAKISAGSRRECWRDSRRVTGFPVAKTSVGVLPGFAARKKIPGGQTLVGIRSGSEIPGSHNLRGSCLESCRD